MKSDDLQLMLFEKPENTLSSDARSLVTSLLGKPGPIRIEPVEEQLDFDQLWADRLREKYGIRNPME